MTSEPVLTTYRLTPAGVSWRDEIRHRAIRNFDGETAFNLRFGAGTDRLAGAIHLAVADQVALALQTRKDTP